MAVRRIASEALFEQAFALHRQGQLVEASSLYEAVLRQEPDHFGSLHLLGVIAAQTNLTERAEELIGRALALNSRDAPAHCDYGNVLHALGRHAAAIESYGRCLSLNPEYADAYLNRGITLAELQRNQDAILDLERAVALRPDRAAAFLGLARALANLGKIHDALRALDQAISVAPRDADAHNLRGIALAETGRLEEALDSLSMAIEISPNRPDFHNNYGNLLRIQGRLDMARRSLERALAIAPDHVDAHFNLGIVLTLLKEEAQALASYERVVELRPAHAGAHQNRGLCLRALRDFDGASSALRTALALNPRSAEVHRALGLVAFDRNRHEEALAYFDGALGLRPELAEAWYGRANALIELRRYQDAVTSYERALSLQPDYRFVRGLWMHAKLLAADWNHLDTGSEELVRRAALNEAVSPPFHALSIVDSPDVHRQLARTWVDTEARADPQLGPIPAWPRHERIRVGYFSADFHNHATMVLLGEVLELHDPARFEVTAFSFGRDSQGPTWARLKSACERAIDVRANTDRDIAALARSLEIDVAVDLKGFTLDSRPGIFALRAAPIQVNYLGFPGTLSAPYIDYLIADRTLIPETTRPHYSEKIVYLPNCYQPNDSKRVIAETVMTREAQGLPAAGFVFCCFNAHYKILPRVFDVWMRLLETIEGSVLWLLGDNPDAVRNLCREAQARGVDPNRLVFAPTLPLPDHLARHRCADLFLDTSPCNAHTTASDALWAGLPLLTCMGSTFAGRVAASLLRAVRLPELITEDLEHYERCAIELASQPLLLREIRRRLETQRTTAPLFDAARYARQLEAAYERMMHLARSDALPRDIYL